MNPDCPRHLACILEKCQDPCQSTTCGVNAECSVDNHIAVCTCRRGYEGDPYSYCEERKEGKLAINGLFMGVVRMQKHFRALQCGLKEN